MVSPQPFQGVVKASFDSVVSSMKHEGSTAKMIQMKNEKNLFNKPIHCASEMLQIVLNFVLIFLYS